MSRLSGWNLMIAVVAIALWSGFVLYMIQHLVVDEITWARLSWLYGSVEAVAFAAVGAIFGTRVQRQRAEAAEHRADTNEHDAGRGRGLALALKSEETASPADTKVIETYGPAQRDGAAAVIVRHAALANTFFPDL